MQLAIYNGVLCESSQEHKLFGFNLKQLIEKNKQEGFVPKEEPPEEIKQYTVNVNNDDPQNFSNKPASQIKAPNYLAKPTLSAIKKYSRRRQSLYTL